MSSLFEEYTPLTDMDNPFRPSPLPTTVFGTRPASPCGIADDNFLASIEKEFAFDDNFFGLPSFDDFAGIDDDDFLAAESFSFLNYLHNFCSVHFLPFVAGSYLGLCR